MTERANLFLIGPRGSGKSTVARLLAQLLTWDFVDSDTLLETRFGKSIRQIFAEEGEAGFRDKEAQVLEALCNLSRQVVATGGGVVLREENRARLASAGYVVWLDADPETLWRRMHDDSTTSERRPALTAAGGLQEVEEVIRSREPLYRACANLYVPTAGRTPELIAADIRTKLPSVKLGL